MPRRSTLWRQAPLLIALVIVAAVSSACSSSSSGTTSTTLSAATRAELNARGTLCTLITPADIKAVTGVTVARPPVGIHGRQTTCNYKAHVLASSVVTQFDSGVTPASFQAFSAKVSGTSGQTTPVAGLTEGAYSFSAAVGSGTVNSVVMLVASMQVIVTGTYPVSQLQSLASTIVARFPASRSSTTTLPTGATG